MPEEETPKETPKENQPEELSATAQATRKSSNTTLLVMVACIIVAALALIFALMKSDKKDKGVEVSLGGPTAIGNLVDDQEYMIYIRKVEVQSKKANGEVWDSGNSAPDVFYRLLWKNNQIYESGKKQNSLIASWIPIGISLKESILSGAVSVDQAIKLPIVKYDKNLPESDELLFKIIDSDVFGNDEIENLTIYLSKLKLGDNIFDFKGKTGHGLIKAVVRVIDNDLSTNEKVEMLMRGK